MEYYTFKEEDGRGYSIVQSNPYYSVSTATIGTGSTYPSLLEGYSE
jgi:hypothetical protein